MGENEKCYFCAESEEYGICKILLGQEIKKERACNGFDKNCKFNKSKKEFIKSRDESIQKCRNKKLCNKCYYIDGLNAKCKLSTEKEKQSEF
jgi:hypothetical protein